MAMYWSQHTGMSLTFASFNNNPLLKFKSVWQCSYYLVVILLLAVSGKKGNFPFRIPHGMGNKCENLLMTGRALIGSLFHKIYEHKDVVCSRDGTRTTVEATAAEETHTDRHMCFWQRENWFNEQDTKLVRLLRQLKWNWGVLQQVL